MGQIADTSNFVTPYTLLQNPEKPFHILDDREAKRLLMQLAMFGVFRPDPPERNGQNSVQILWSERETHFVFGMLFVGCQHDGFEVFCFPKKLVTMAQAVEAISKKVNVSPERLLQGRIINTQPLLDERITNLDQVADILPPEERERLEKIKLHSLSRFSFSGQHLPHPDEKENLFEFVLERTRYIVDSNIGWKIEAAKPENRDKAFIIPSTVLEENPNTKSLIFKNVDLTNRNLFMLTADSRGILLERVDEYLPFVFDDKKIDALRNRESEYYGIHERERRHIVEEMRAEFLEFFGVKTVEEFDALPDLAERQELFLARIRQQASNCKLDMFRCFWVAFQCYGALLTRKGEARTKLFRFSNLNIFGDTFVLVPALYLQAHILTEDGDLCRMARYAGLQALSRIGS